MAKKEKEQKEKAPRTVKTSRWRFADLFAFIALATAAILFVVGPVLNAILARTGGQEVMQYISAAGQCFLLAAIAIPAWYFVRNKSRGWIVFYIIALVVYVVGTVLGFTIGTF